MTKIKGISDVIIENCVNTGSIVWKTLMWNKSCVFVLSTGTDFHDLCLLPVFGWYLHSSEITWGVEGVNTLVRNDVDHLMCSDVSASCLYCLEADFKESIDRYYYHFICPRSRPWCSTSIVPIQYTPLYYYACSVQWKRLFVRWWKICTIMVSLAGLCGWIKPESARPRTVIEAVRTRAWFSRKVRPDLPWLWFR